MGCTELGTLAPFPPTPPMRILPQTDQPFSSETDHPFSWETDQRSPLKPITSGPAWAEGDRQGRTVIGMRGERVIGLVENPQRNPRSSIFRNAWPRCASSGP